MEVIPQPPWTLTGEVALALAWGARLPTTLPAGVRWAPGPVVVMAQRWTSSPVGPYVAFVIGRPARVGRRVGVSLSTVVVSSTDARLGGRRFWGVPGEFGTLRWQAEADRVEVVWEERGISMRGVPGRRRLPLGLRAHALQGLEGDLVMGPGRLDGRAALARWELDVPADDPLRPLWGRRRGVHVAGAALALGPAVPAAARAWWRAASTEIEPGLP